MRSTVGFTAPKAWSSRWTSLPRRSCARRARGSPGHEPAQQPVGVLVRATLPGGVRVAKPDVDLQPPRQFGMAGPLGTAVAGHALARGGGQAFHLPGEAVEHRLGAVAAHLAQTNEAGLALEQCADGGAVERPLIRSPSQCAGTRRASISSGRLIILSSSAAMELPATSLRGRQHPAGPVTGDPGQRVIHRFRLTQGDDVGIVGHRRIVPSGSSGRP